MPAATATDAAANDAASPAKDTAKSATQSAVKPIHPKGRTRVGNGRSLFLGNIDQRCLEYRRFKELFAEVAADLDSPLSGIEKQIVKRVVQLSIKAEEMEARAVSGANLDATEYVPVCNSLRRFLEDLEMRRWNSSKRDKNDLAATMAWAMVPKDVRDSLRARRSASEDPAPTPQGPEVLPPEERAPKRRSSRGADAKSDPGETPEGSNQ